MKNQFFNWDETPWLYFQVPIKDPEDINVTMSWWQDPVGEEYKVKERTPDTIDIWHSLDNWDKVRVLGDWNVRAKYTARGGDDTNTTGEGYTSFKVVPEPISSILFLTGGATLVARHYWKKRQSSFLSTPAVEKVR